MIRLTEEGFFQRWVSLIRLKADEVREKGKETTQPDLFQIAWEMKGSAGEKTHRQKSAWAAAGQSRLPKQSATADDTFSNGEQHDTDDCGWGFE